MSDDNENEKSLDGPLSSIVKKNGQPFNEWIVTFDGTVEGWWGEGYVVHAADPFMIFKWGFTSEIENQAMSGGFGFGNEKYLSVLLVNHGTENDLSYEEVREFIPGAVLAAVQKVKQINAEPEPT